MEHHNLKKYFRTSCGGLIDFPIVFENISHVFRDSEEDEIHLDSISYNTMDFVKQFYQQHDYDDKQIKIQIPLRSQDIEEEMDDISWNLIQDYAGIQNMEKMLPILDAAQFLGLEKLKNVCNAAMFYEFNIEDTQQGFDQFQQKNANQIQKLSQKQEQQYKEEFDELFKDMNNIGNSYIEKQYIQMKRDLKSQVTKSVDSEEDSSESEYNSSMYQSSQN